MNHAPTQRYHVIVLIKGKPGILFSKIFNRCILNTVVIRKIRNIMISVTILEKAANKYF